LASAKASTGASTTDNTALTDLLSQKNVTLAQELAVSQAQYGVLSNLGGLPPFGGTFHGGGLVPGPVGSERMARVLAGERITPIDGEGGPVIENHVHVDRKSDLHKLIDVRVEQITRRQARTGARVLPGRAGGLVP
jgi:hypothetical protein